jgi:putative endonuclease
VYFEKVFGMAIAIKREKEIKGWSRGKKELLIESVNQEWKFLNDDVL